MARCIWIGVLSAIADSFLVAPLLALVYKFPIPFSGMERGPSAAVHSLFAVAFYGVLGGFVVLGVLGAAAGAVASKVAGADRHRAWKLALVFGLAAESHRRKILAKNAEKVRPNREQFPMSQCCKPRCSAFRN
jgi:hypothetical protein